MCPAGRARMLVRPGGGSDGERRNEGTLLSFQGKRKKQCKVDLGWTLLMIREVRKKQAVIDMDYVY